MKTILRKTRSIPAFLCLVTAVLFAGISVGAEPPAPLAKIELKTGDTLLFLGDSITHQCLYTQFIEDYYFTRYTHTKLHFYNAGVSGDKAADALARFEGDVAALKPAYVTVLLGMNDGQYRHFAAEVFQRYETDMSLLIDKLNKLGTRTILMGPSMYDARVSKTKPPSWVARNPEQGKEVTNYYPAVLAFFGAWQRDQATHGGLGYVELQSVMELVTREKRIAQPSFTMIPDAVHPNADGHAVMAHAILEQMHAKRQVSSIMARREPKGWRVSGQFAKISAVEGDDQSLRFTVLTDSLPWVLPEDAEEGYRLAKSGHKLSNERLRILGLPAGRYDLSIDGVKVGTYSHATLAAKVELQANKKTPQYQQALAVARLNKKRNDEAIRPLRNKWLELRGRFVRPGKTGSAEYEAYLPEFRRRIEELEKKSREFEERIYAAAQPVARHYSITRAKPAKKR